MEDGTLLKQLFYCELPRGKCSKTQTKTYVNEVVQNDLKTLGIDAEGQVTLAENQCVEENGKQWL